MTKPTFTKEYKAIEDVLLNHYSKGNIEADSSIQKPAFHEVAAMYNVDDNGDLAGGPVAESLFPAVDSFDKSENPLVAIAYIDIAGNAASARVDSDNISGYGFSDYFNLLKVQGKWQIINKIFHSNY